LNIWYQGATQNIYYCIRIQESVRPKHRKQKLSVVFATIEFATTGEIFKQHRQQQKKSKIPIFAKTSDFRNAKNLK